MRPFPVVRVRLSEILEICMLCVQNNADNSFVVPFGTVLEGIEWDAILDGPITR